MRDLSATPSLARRDALRLVRMNAAQVALAMGVSLAFNAALFWNAAPDAFARGMVSAALLPLILGVPLFWYLSLQLSSLWGMNDRLIDSARRDSLTRLLNRGAFIEAVDEKLREMAASNASRGAFLVIDADYFKLINDRWGHVKGDEALCRIADAIGRLVKEDDIAGRLGGEEFGVFLCGSSSHGAYAAAERLRSVVEALELRSTDNNGIPVTVSVGAVHFRESLPFKALYQLADRKLYEAKANGRNRVEFEMLDAEAALGIAA